MNPSVKECKKREVRKMINLISNLQWATKIYTAHKTKSQSTKRSEIDQGLQCRKISKLPAMIKPKQEGLKLKPKLLPRAQVDNKGIKLWGIALPVQPTTPMSK